jgi:hypothetical protein
VTWAASRRAFDALAAYHPEAEWPWDVVDDGGKAAHLRLHLPAPLRGVVGASPRVWRLELGTAGARRPDRIKMFAILRMPPERVVLELIGALESETKRLTRDRRAVLLREALGRLAHDTARAGGEARRAAQVSGLLGDAALDEQESVAARHWYATAVEDALAAEDAGLAEVLTRKLATAEATEQQL